MLENNNLKNYLLKFHHFGFYSYIYYQSKIFKKTKHIVDFATSVELQIIKQRAFIYSNFTLFLPFVLYNMAEYI